MLSPSSVECEVPGNRLQLGAKYSTRRQYFCRLVYIACSSIYIYDILGPGPDSRVLPTYHFLDICRDFHSINFDSYEIFYTIILLLLVLVLLLAQVQAWAELRFSCTAAGLLVSSNFEGSKQISEIVPCRHHAGRRKLPICCRGGGVRELVISTYVCF